MATSEQNDSSKASHPIELNNQHLSVILQNGTTAYNGSRFEHSAQISQITLDQKHTFLGTEKEDYNPQFGFGLLNEFDNPGPQQYDETPVGSCFHKIGVGGLLKTDNEPYFFATDYEIKQPLDWNINQINDQFIQFSTSSPCIRGMQYDYQKSIELVGNQLIMSYLLKNTGETPIDTENYSHNFLTFDNKVIGPGYELELPKTIQSENFGEYVDPENLLQLKENTICWNTSPSVDFFISNLLKSPGSGLLWKLKHHQTQTSMTETVDFESTHFNFWGKNNVTSPEIFHQIHLKPGETRKWCRTFTMQAMA